jgi:hypothetical protein
MKGYFLKLMPLISVTSVKLVGEIIERLHTRLPIVAIMELPVKNLLNFTF